MEVHFSINNLQEKNCFLTLPLDMNRMYNKSPDMHTNGIEYISDVRRKRNKCRATYPEIVQTNEEKENTNKQATDRHIANVTIHNNSIIAAQA